MRHRPAVIALLVGMALMNSSCEPTTAVAVPVLVITATWDVEGQEGRSFTFSADQDDSEGLEWGTFDGSENREDLFEFYNLEGSWENGEIEFTVDRSGVQTRYTGTFTQDRPSRLTFYSSGETIVLVQP